jgi:DNA-directed RNA polymerase omega subunit
VNKSEIDGLAEKFGGRFKLTVLIQKRVRELVKGAQKLVDSEHKNLIDIAVEEIKAGKVAYEGMELADDGGRKGRKKDD